MKVKELIAQLKKLNADDAEVFVSVTNCITAYAAEPVTSVSRGFDWTAGKIILTTNKKLHRYQKCCQSCALCSSSVGERVRTRLYREEDKSLSLCVEVDGKRKCRIKIVTSEKEGGAE